MFCTVSHGESFCVIGFAPPLRGGANYVLPSPLGEGFLRSKNLQENLQVLLRLFRGFFMGMGMLMAMVMTVLMAVAMLPMISVSAVIPMAVGGGSGGLRGGNLIR